ncbi:MAG: AcrR family transcriptional regulator [Myxococcota bacterium]
MRTLARPATCNGGRGSSGALTIGRIALPRPRFDRLPSQKQRAVLETAAAEFIALGYHRASLNRVQTSLGLSKGAFYYWFDDKEDLFLAVLQDRLAVLQRSVGGLLAGPPEPRSLWDQVEETCAAMIRCVFTQPGTLRLLKAALSLSPDASSRTQAVWGRLRDGTEALIVEGQLRGDVRSDLPSALLASVALGILEGFDRHMLATEDHSASPTEAAQVIVDLLQRAVGA